MRLLLEVEGEGAAQELPGGGEALVAFMSFAFLSGLGAQHPLLALAERLRRPHRIPIGALTNFYDATAEDAEDREKLELAWQPAADVVEALEGLLRVLAEDEQAQVLLRRAEADQLPGDAQALLEAVRGPAADGGRVRLSYVL